MHCSLDVTDTTQLLTVCNNKSSYYPHSPKLTLTQTARTVHTSCLLSGAQRMLCARCRTHQTLLTEMEQQGSPTNTRLYSLSISKESWLEQWEWGCPCDPRTVEIPATIQPRKAGSLSSSHKSCHLLWPQESCRMVLLRALSYSLQLISIQEVGYNVKEGFLMSWDLMLILCLGIF